MMRWMQMEDATKNKELQLHGKNPLCMLKMSSLHIVVHYILYQLTHCWLGDRQAARTSDCKQWALVCWWWWFDWSFARLVAAVVTTTSVILTSNEIQNGDILVPANPGSPGKWPL